MPLPIPSKLQEYPSNFGIAIFEDNTLKLRNRWGYLVLANVHHIVWDQKPMVLLTRSGDGWGFTLHCWSRPTASDPHTPRSITLAVTATDAANLYDYRLDCSLVLDSGKMIRFCKLNDESEYTGEALPGPNYECRYDFASDEEAEELLDHRSYVEIWVSRASR